MQRLRPSETRNIDFMEILAIIIKLIFFEFFEFFIKKKKSTYPLKF